MKQLKQSPFFYQSAITVLIANIFSANTYSFYWFYKQWKTVGLHEGVKTHPIIAAIFSEFTGFVLFKKIWRAAPSSKVKNRHLYLIPAILFLLVATIVLILSFVFLDQPLTVLAFSFGAILINSVLYAWVQQVINTTAPKEAESIHKLQLTPPEIVFFVIGFIGFFSNIPALLLLPSSDTIMQRTENFQKTTDLLQVRYDKLDAEFTKCNDMLRTRYEMLDTTSQVAVDAYNKDIEPCQEIMKERDAVGNKMLSLSAQFFRGLFIK